MPVIFHYLLHLFLMGILKVMGIFVGLFFLLDGMESIRRYSQKVNFSWPDWMLLMAFRIPTFLIQFMPSIALLATLTVLTKLARQNEITVMRASGVPIYRILIPFLMGGVIMASLHVVVQDQIVPRTNSAANQVVNHIKNTPAASNVETGELWLRDGQQIIHAEQTSVENGALLKVTVFNFDTDHRLLNRVEARKGEVREDKWYLVDGVEYTMDGQTPPHPFQHRFWEVNLKTGQFDRTTPQPKYLSFNQLWAYADRLQSEGYDATPYWVMLHRKLADPAATLSAVLLAFPFSLRMHRMGGGTKSLLAGILAGFGMFVLVDLSSALGLGGRLPPALAAWAPVAFFLGIGGFLLNHLANPHHGR
ncbi:MAG: LPS export ABC transporter permease LptG [Magnetococcales bacterium]|nr:LPS export ABC transporter permease LptG [Magnetococcales bacterium]